MQATSITQACNLIIFGTKGDLTRRKLFPSLYQLEKIGAIHPDTRIIGVGRAEWSLVMYIEVVYASLKKFMLDPIDESLWCIFRARLDFCNLDVHQTERFVHLLDKLQNVDMATINYLATPPDTFGIICKGLSSIGLNKKSNRIVIEKPLGTNLDSARVINAQISEYFEEKQIYRIDHYLGKETVLNLLALRFANYLFSSNWDNNTIDHVQITVAEEVGIEGRWGYFDAIGQMRDMIQSHLLQILTIIAMSPPSNLSADCIRDEKVKVLQSLRKIDGNHVHNVTVRGQYTSGFIHGKPVPGYLEEKGANKSSNTETFVSLCVNIDNWRWAGVPFYLRTGKRLPIKYSEIVIFFKKPVINLFPDSYQDLPNNKLTIRLQPNEGIDVQILNKIPGLGHKHRLQATKLNLSFYKTFCPEHIVDAYERLLLETMRGIQVLFVRHDEIEGAWKWVDSIIQSWELENNVPKLYQAGTWGPVESMTMIAKDGRFWNKYKLYT
ncbi:glucose-6-phosphate dehydrogenase [Candidatus Blochmannia vicinus (nom. nud.)]|uniref:Glucose-6-phosphate 1-dehydrogenase n=1 Tax=Candidatus Blochmannia vicinus (nom. nud.) TaxID=251540 RepID=A0A9Q8U0A4_9ENTR|nr:glucose-6-phosphate dehydrogenase [Candidatus Blochmannia vicinus]URJ28315.1 glucose-6-phosphate dehydrogenase [Candidatus Blochmannia vicinus]